MAENKTVFISNRVYTSRRVQPACIFVENGTIVRITEKKSDVDFKSFEVVDVGELLVTPGVVDVHVHISEPGRAHWEGYVTGTRAAAAGGVTTIINMPINSIPSTTTLTSFKEKLKSAEGKCYVDVGFWGGIIPGNQGELVPMLEAGVLGFKCFMIHSGMDDFPPVQAADIEMALQVVQGRDVIVLFHAEVDCNCNGASSKTQGPSNAYKTMLDTRTEAMELEAIRIVCRLCLKYNVPCHIVHLSAASALPLIIEARKEGAPLTVETTHHYLTLEAEAIPDGATEFKCFPPIRSKENQNRLWAGLKAGHIDMVVSDHSPCPRELRNMDSGNFTTAWGGIASLQFGLSLFWTHVARHDMGLDDVITKLCTNPARLVNLQHRKGEITVGYDADLVVWDPEDSYKITEDNIYHQDKVTPFLGQVLKGVVKRTVVRGRTVYHEGQFPEKPPGSFLLRPAPSLE